MKKSLIVIVLFLAFGITTACADAQAIASLTYTETALTLGRWQYDYTIHNLLDPATYPGYNLFDVQLGFLTSRVSTQALPAGWSSFVNPPTLEIFSENVGAPPVGNDIAPGKSLSGFRFLTNYRAGNISYTASFSDPADNLIQFSGTSIKAAAVPAPSSLLTALLGAATVGTLFVYRRAKQDKERRLLPSLSAHSA